MTLYINAFISLYQGSSDCMAKEKPYDAERSSEVTLLTGRYEYSRRPKLDRKRSGSFFKSLTMGEDDRPKLASKRLKRSHARKNLDQAAQVDAIIPTPVKKLPEPDTSVSILGGKRPRNIRSQTSEKVVSLIQGILLSSVPTDLEQMLKVLLISS